MFHTFVATPLAVVTLSLVLCALAAALLRRKVRPVAEAAWQRLLARLRPHVPARLRRTTGQMLRWVDPETTRSVLVTAVAASIAWSAAHALGMVGPVTAAISATLSVQLSSHASLREGAKRLIGTVAGIALTVAVWGLFGLSPWSIAVITGGGLIMGRLLRLGDSSVTVPLTSLGILIAGSTVTEAFVWQRVAATALGIVVGVILSPLVGGMTPLERARHQLGKLSAELGRLLGELAHGARDGYTQEQAAQWLARSRELREELDDASDAVEEASRQARWSLTTPSAHGRSLHQTLRTVEHGVHQVNSVARSMYDSAATPHAADVPEQIGTVLAAASNAFAAHATDDDRHLTELVGELREARKRTMRKVRTEVDDTGVLVLTGSIITDIDRMTGSLERSAPALAVGEREPELGIPAVSEVVPAVRRVWERRRDRTYAPTGR